jgi:hypothetical protein
VRQLIQLAPTESGTNIFPLFSKGNEMAIQMIRLCDECGERFPFSDEEQAKIKSDLEKGRLVLKPAYLCKRCVKVTIYDDNGIREISHAGIVVTKQYK